MGADDPSLAEDEKKAALAQSAALQKTEQAGQPSNLFAAYMGVAANECMDRYDENAMAKAKANLPKLGRDPTLPIAY